MSIREKIQELFASYKIDLNEFRAFQDSWKTDTTYSAQVKRDRLAEGQKKMDEVDFTANQKFREILNEEISRIENSRKRGEGFNVELSNTLSFINLIGDKMDDMTAFELVHPFIGDYPTMRTWSKVFANFQGVNVTLSILNTFNGMIKKLNDISIKFERFNSRDFTHSQDLPIYMQMVEGEMNEYEALEKKLNTAIAAEGGLENTFKALTAIPASDMRKIVRELRESKTLGEAVAGAYNPKQEA